MTSIPYGLRVVGGKAAERRIVEHDRALAAYAECDPRAALDRESFLTHFQFPDPIRKHFDREGSERGYNGPCGADWLYWDIDRPGDLAHALRDTRRLAARVLDRYRELGEDDLLIFLSGGKGFHIAIPAALWQPEPSPAFHDTAKRFALALAERAGVAVDATLYSKTRLLRAPNSRHPSGRHKRRLDFGGLMHLRTDAILDLAAEPSPFEVPTPTATSATAMDDWREAMKASERRADERRTAYRDGAQRLTAETLRYIREGATEGERATALFRAAANLAELDCSPALADALLTEAALDSGLTPGETRRQIDCGLAHARRQREGGMP